MENRAARPGRSETADSGERVVVVARLRPGSRDRAGEILAAGTPYNVDEAGFRRHSVYLAEETAIFLFEGHQVGALVRELLNDPARSAAFSVWGPLLDGTPTIAQEAFHWEAGNSVAGR
jgi:hypothetical protein